MKKFLLAETFYHTANSLQSNVPLIQKDYATMLNNWAAILEQNGYTDLAKAKRKKANELWKVD